jgi:hypothetical protein
MKISLFPEGIKNIASKETIDLSKVYSLIKHDYRLNFETMCLRRLKGEEQNDYKTKVFPYVTFGGIFGERKDSSLIKESGLVCIDIDHLPDALKVKEELIQKCRCVIMAFISPRGNGLKVVCRCNANFSFKENYLGYSSYLKDQLGIPLEHFDKSCASISKACFLCYDSEVFFDEDRLTAGKFDGYYYPVLANSFFEASPISNSLLEVESEKSFSINSFLQQGLDYYPVKLNYEKKNDISNFVSLNRIVSRNKNEFRIGNRHNYLLKLAAVCNSFGMTKEFAISHFRAAFSNHPAVLDTQNPFDEKNDLLKVFEDVYTANLAEFSSWVDKDEQWQTPFIAESIYEKLPAFIKSTTNLFNGRERDVYFLGALTLLSACFPKVYGVYNNRRYRPNLFLFVSAPAASGKGVLNWVRMLGSNIHQIFLDNYIAELANYEELEEDEKKEAIKPTLKKFFIPANNTSAKLMQTLEINKGMGVVFDTEADTLSKANKSDHGNFSDIYRKAFEHETLECERKSNNEYFCINEPALSVIISGTPNQVKNLVNDLENGLTSRFMFYSYTCKADWKDVFADGEDHDFKFKSEAVRLAEMVKPYLFYYLEDPKDEIQFIFSENQQKQFNEWFSIKLGELDLVYGRDINASIYRMGTILFRIAMTLTIVRNIEKPSFDRAIPDLLICDDIDFEIAINVVDSLLHHTAAVFSQLKGKRHKRNHKPLKELFYEKLPAEFNRENAMEVARVMQIPEKTAESYLSQGTKDGVLNKPKHNHYIKP